MAEGEGELLPGEAAAFADFLTQWSPTRPPPQTEWFHEIASASTAPEDADLFEAIEKLGDPDVVTVTQIEKVASTDLGNFLQEPKNRMAIPYRFDSCGYVKVINPDQKGGRWFVAGKIKLFTARRRSHTPSRLTAARKLAQEIPTNALATLAAMKRARDEAEMRVKWAEAQVARMEPGTDNVIPMKPVNPFQSCPGGSAFKDLEGKIFQGKY